MFRKVLIANRGEIAVRVARTLRAMGIGVVAVYSAADRDARHVQVADAAYLIGPAPALESYLHIPAVLDAARRSGAEAVHPGYGFLSENPAFARAVADAGLTFIGPPAGAIERMGDKAGAKRLMARAGVPTVPGYSGDDQSDATLAAEAGRIGFPLLIKAVAGGGGMGMRAVYDAGEFPAALAAARRTAHRAFGDDRVLLERLIVRPRHVEVQVFADTQGNVIALGERECSIQRRHQKVLEESPSPAVTPALRERLYAAAITAAQVAGYVNAGTVEFLLDAAGEFSFLEMNTRLQVEHPVTEAVTGLDLVRLQLAIAAGAPLPLAQAAVTLAGHAIECRVYAEDPEREYLPQTGTISALAEPHALARVDSALYPGVTITPYYDPLLAKVITHGATRAEAVARMQAALAAYRIGGVTTNLPQLRAIVAADAFRAGDTHTGFLDERWRPGTSAPLPEAALLAIAGHEATRRHHPAEANPWRALGPLRLGGAAVRGTYAVDGAAYAIAATRAADNLWSVTVRPAAHPDAPAPVASVTFDRPTPDRLLIARDGVTTPATIHDDGPDGFTLAVADGTYRVRRAGLLSPEQLADEQPGDSDGAGALTAPLAGVVARVLVQAGETVAARQPLVVVEAMKMEHTVAAPTAARVRAVPVAPGDRVAGGAVLIELEPA